MRHIAGLLGTVRQFSHFTPCQRDRNERSWNLSGISIAQRFSWIDSDDDNEEEEEEEGWRSDRAGSRLATILKLSVSIARIASGDDERRARHLTNARASQGLEETMVDRTEKTVCTMSKSTSAKEESPCLSARSI